MLKQIILRDQKIDYTLKTSYRARHLRLIIHGDGRLVVTQPRFLGGRIRENFIRDKADWIITRLDHFKKFPSPLIAGSGRRADYLSKREDARALITERLDYFNKFYHFKYNRVSIRNQSTRWGSCSRPGNLSFNYRLLDLPAAVSDYVIVHELCHLRELNHSSRFWQLVAKVIPDYDERRRKLRSKISGV